jgi:hypothetical protein
MMNREIISFAIAFDTALSSELHMAALMLLKGGEYDDAGRD